MQNQLFILLILTCILLKKKFCTKRVDFWSAPFLIVCIGIFMVKFFTSIFEQILVE
ncbi:hypothetical protein LBGG_01138 [Lactobacillus gasseri MV-22]|nr:hypothetical protein LBGG_01138 [Lactobacillus gasseri MV-22]